MAFTFAQLAKIGIWIGITGQHLYFERVAEHEEWGFHMTGRDWAESCTSTSLGAGQPPSPCEAIFLFGGIRMEPLFFATLKRTFSNIIYPLSSSRLLLSS